MTCGPASFLPFTYVPLVLFRSRTMILPSLTTILVCFLEMFPLGRQMSFSSTRPTVISSAAKSSRWVGPPFSVRMTLNPMSKLPLAGAAYKAFHNVRAVKSAAPPNTAATGRGPPRAGSPPSIEEAEGDGGRGVLVGLAAALDQLLDAVRGGRNQPRRHVDGELRLALDELAALEELAQDGDRAKERHLGDLLRLVVVEQSGKDDGFSVLHGHVRPHLPQPEAGYVESVGADGQGAVDVAHRGIDLGRDGAAAAGGRSDLEDDPELLELDSELVLGGDQERDLASGRELGLLAARAQQPGLREDALVPVVEPRSHREVRGCRQRARDGVHGLGAGVARERADHLVHGAGARARDE